MAFLLLPSEIRLQIYTHVLFTPFHLIRPQTEAEDPWRSCSILPLPLLRTSKTIHEEATPHFYTINCFYISTVPVVSDPDPLPQCPPSSQSIIARRKRGTRRPSKHPAFPISGPYIPFLRNFSIRVRSPGLEPIVPCLDNDSHLTTLTHLIAPLRAGHANLSLLTLRLAGQPCTTHISLAPNPSTLLQQIDPENSIAIAVCRLPSVRRVEIWKEWSVCAPVGDVEVWKGWDTVGPDDSWVKIDSGTELERIREGCWKDAREVEFRKRKRNLARQSFGGSALLGHIAQGVAIMLAK